MAELRTRTDASEPMHRPLSFPLALLLLFALELLYDTGIRHLPAARLALVAPAHALGYAALFWLVSTRDLARLTLACLALPYLIFLPGWLNAPTALVGLSAVLWSGAQLWHRMDRVAPEPPCYASFAAFLLVLVWLNLSGSGGYGYQSYDYVAHNARLNDLIVHTWPVRYDVTHWGQEHNLVYYSGYLMPAALIGKFTGYDNAVAFLHFWTLALLLLALRWLAVLARRPLTLPLVALFAVFGPQDILGLGVLYHFEHNTPGDFVRRAWGGDLVEFWASEHSSIFFGSFLSNTSQFFWSPPQVLAGWLMAGWLAWLYERGERAGIVFAYSLLCLWAPLPMIALLPLVACATLPALFRTPSAVLTVENVAGAGTLALVFGCYYLSGDVGSNPADWVWNDALPVPVKLFVLALFLLFTWGLYALAIAPAAREFPANERRWHRVLLATMLLLPLHSFGNYNDLMCRGSAPLMFLLLVAWLRAFDHYGHTGQHGRRLAVVACLALGTLSAASQLSVALSHYGETRPVRSVTDYRESHETLGPDGTRFEKYFRKSLPAPAP